MTVSQDHMSSLLRVHIVKPAPQRSQGSDWKEQLATYTKLFSSYIIFYQTGINPYKNVNGQHISQLHILTSYLQYT